MNSSQKDSAIIIAIAITLLITGGVASVITYAVMREKKNEDSQSKEESKDDSKRTVADWTEYRSEKFTMPIPDGWKMQKRVVDTYTHDSDGEKEPIKAVTLTALRPPKIEYLIYRPGTPATIKEIYVDADDMSNDSSKSDNDSPNANISMVSVRSRTLTYPLDTYLKGESSERTTENGYILHSAVKVTKNEQPGDNGLAIGSKAYVYIVMKSKDSEEVVYGTYFVRPDAQDGSNHLEAALMELKFL